MSKAEIIFDPIDSITSDLESKVPIDSILKQCRELDKAEFDQLLTELSTAYYHKTPITIDENWDLLESLYEQLYGERKKVGAIPPTYPNSKVKEEKMECETVSINRTKNKLLEKIKLPKYMGSLDKKKDNKSIGLWLKSLDETTSDKVLHTFVFMDKLDGVSAYYENNGGKYNLFKRGNGVEGSDISFLIQYLRLPKLNVGESVRGELVLKKSVFRDKYANDKATARNAVAGATNTKHYEENLVRDIDFVAFQHYSNSSQSEQLKWLAENKFNVVDHYTTNDVSDLDEENLEGVVKLRKRESEYDMDGIVIAHDVKISQSKQEEKEGNPKHMIAFKIQGTTGITKVTGVEWNLSQYGVYKPVVLLNTIRLDGVSINRANGFNAKYIEDNKIGPNAKVMVERRNDVLPIILDVITPSEPSFPSTPYRWNENHVDIIIPEGVSNIEVDIQKIVRFFSELDIKFLAETTVKKIYNHLRNKNKDNPTLLDFLTLTKDDLSGLEGFGDVLSNKIISAIQTGITNVELVKVMSGSGVFGVGFAIKRLQLIVDTYPDILSFSSQYTVDEIEQKIKAIKGFKTIAKNFADNLQSFNTFLTSHPQIKFIIDKRDIVVEKVGGIIGKSVANLEFVFTGFRDHTIEKLITQNGGKVRDGSVTKKTNILIKKSGSDESTKEKTARKYNIPILTLEEFTSRFNIEIE